MPDNTKEANLGQWLFSGDCQFIAGVTGVDHLPPPEAPEIAFCGLSNVGKSSLLNALTGRNHLAKTSNTPGRTRQLNFFLLRERLMLVDLPGYGYAKASKKEIAGWTTLTHDYLKGRPNLKRVCLLIDSRRGLKPTDINTMKLLDDYAISYQITLTKTDKSKKEDVTKIISAIKQQSDKHPALHPDIMAVSSRTKAGLSDLKQALTEFI